MADPRVPVVHVLLATHNGERHLAQQWASIEAQLGVEVVVHVGDDASTDGTVALVRRLAAQRSGAVREVRWIEAPPRRSACRSFLLLLEEATRAVPQLEWVAYCDQDDVWLPGKLRAGVDALLPAEPGRPALYGGRTLSVDEGDREQGLSELFRKPPCFRNAVAQSIMGGNTMLFNGAAAHLVAGSAREEVTAHDWFTYQLVSGAGGFVHYDSRAFVRYRQHGNNQVGSNIGWRATVNRLKRMFFGRQYTEWNELHVRALRKRSDSLTSRNRAILEDFHRARQSRTPWMRLLWLRRSGVFRQPGTQQFILWLGAVARRI